ILIVDDHPIVRHGLRELIARQPDLEMSGEAADVAEALRQIETNRPDAAIIDISLGGDNGLELVERIKGSHSEIKILVSSMHDEKTFAGRALRAGALGYINKRESIRKVIDAVRQVLRGEIYLSPQMANQLLHRAAVGEPLDHDPMETLSNRELEVFEMIGQGMNTQQIAGKLDRSPRTIETHRKKIKTKLNLQNGAQLSRAAFQWVQESR
ncbi:MAG: response regulator transcription factor, partial [Planctomycetes bacterium]|nr:response regulator transcription factor [Planctomycetota bacterium]